ncbi:hypothetical protein D3C72_1745870 [compost metagenome]
MQRAAGRDRHGQQHRLFVTHQGFDRPGLLVLAVLGVGGFQHRAAQVNHHQRTHRANQERDSPAPGLQIVKSQHILQHHHGEQCQQLAGDDGEVLERAEEAALARARHFADVSCASAVFGADRKALHQPGDEQEHRGGHADAFIGG